MKDKINDKITFRLEDDWHKQATETVWASKLSDGKYRIENVPFYAKGVSHGDIVKANVEGDTLLFSEIVEKSKHSTYRIYLMPEISKERFKEVWNSLQVIGCTYEKADKNLYAVDVPPDTNIYKAYELLEKGEKEGIWDFEEGDCGHLIGN